MNSGLLEWTERSLQGGINKKIEHTIYHALPKAAQGKQLKSVDWIIGSIGMWPNMTDTWRKS